MTWPKVAIRFLLTAGILTLGGLFIYWLIQLGFWLATRFGPLRKR